MGSKKNDARIEGTIRSPSNKKKLMMELDDWAGKCGITFMFDHTKLLESDFYTILDVLQKTYERGYKDGRK